MKNSCGLMALFVGLFLSGFSALASTIYYAMPGEPPNLNSMTMGDLESAMVLGHVMEGLTRFSQNTDGTVIPGVAEKWVIRQDSATFWLRKNARWSDGSPVTAHDFVFAWQTAVDPKAASTNNAVMLFAIKNAEAITQGKLPPSALGVKATNDYTLDVQFEAPCSYFLSLTAVATFYPTKKEFYEKQGSRYAGDAAAILYNGPYVLTKWAHSSSIVMEKNPHYWNPGMAKIDRIEIPYMTPDANAKYNFYKSGKIDVLPRLGKDDAERAKRDGQKLQTTLGGRTTFLQFNVMPGRVLSKSKSLRQAISAVVRDNLAEFVSKVVALQGTNPAYTLVPSAIRGMSRPFVREFPYRAQKVDAKGLQKLLEQARVDFGGDPKVGALPAITLLCNDTFDLKREAEYFQNVFKVKLGLDLKLDVQTFKQRIAKGLAGDYDIVIQNWAPDYPDPMTYLELKTTWGDAQTARWSHPKYDELIKMAKATADQPKRMKFMAQAQELMLNEAAIAPLYESATVWLQSPRVQGVIRRDFGPDPDFTYATVRK